MNLEENTTGGTDHIPALPPDPLSTKIFYISGHVLFIFGVIFNTFSIMVFTKKSMRGSLTSFLFAVLAFADLATISNLLCYYFFYFDYRYQVVHYFEGFCNIWAFFWTVPPGMSRWLLTAIAVERVIGVWVPLKAKTICTLRKGKVFIVCLLMIQTLVHLPAITLWRRWGPNWLYHYRHSLYSCFPKIETYFQQKVWDSYIIWVGILNTLLPGVIMIVSGIAIGIRLGHLVRERNRMTQRLDFKYGCRSPEHPDDVGGRCRSAFH